MTDLNMRRILKTPSSGMQEGSGRTSAYTQPAWGANVVHPDDLDLRNVAPGSQPMPAASVQYEAENQKRVGNRMNALRAGANERSRAPLAVPGSSYVPPAPPAPVIDTTPMNRPGIDLRNAQLAERDAWGKPAAQPPLGSPVADQFAQEVLNTRARGTRAAARATPRPAGPTIAPPAPPPLRGSPMAFTVDDAALGKATAPGAPLAPPKATAPGAPGYLDPKLVVPETAPKTGVNRVPGAQTLRAGAENMKSAVDGVDRRLNAALLTNTGRAVGGAAATAVGGIEGQLNVGKVLADPNTNMVDVTAQQGHEAARLASQATGGTLGYAAGLATAPITGPFAPLVGAGLAIPGGYLGGKAYDLFERGAKNMTGQDTRTPLERITPPAAPAAAPTSLRNDNADVNLGASVEVSEAQRRRGALRTNDLEAPDRGQGSGSEFSNAAVQMRTPGGQVKKVVNPDGGVSYSGGNVSGDVSMTDNKGNALRGNTRGISVMGSYGGGSGGSGPDVSAALTAAAQRGDVGALENYYRVKGQGFGGKSAADLQREFSERQENADMPERGTFGYRAAVNDKFKRDTLRQTAEHNSASVGVQREQVDATRKNNAALREQALIPFRITQNNQKLLQGLTQHPSTQGGDPVLMAGALNRIGRPDLAKAYSDEANDALSRAEKSDTLTTNKWKDMEAQFKGKYLNPDKNGNPEANAALESRAYARLKRTNPEAFKANPTQRSQAIQNAIADEELMQTFGNPQDGGFASLLPAFLSGNKLDDRTNEIPQGDFLRGAKIGGKISALRGALSPGNLEGGDRFLELPGGRQNLNLGKLSADAIARLQQHIDDANAQPRK